MSEPAMRKRGRRGSPESWSVDAHVGQRVRMRRTLLGMSQEKLGEAIGLTFQQVQKYERGSNRISAGTLYRLGLVLDVPVSFFFDCYADTQAPAGMPATADDSRISDSSISRREARMLRLWRAAPDSVGDELLSLLVSLSPHLRDAREDEGREDEGREDGDGGTAHTISADAPPRHPLARDGLVLTVPSPAKAGPSVSGGKLALKTAAPSRIKADAAPGGKRRRHGAVWDPADIYRAGKAPTGKPGKAPT
ncbi:transcriptional regulator with XRE-family HTH domain [Azospirillum brasilense]|uniref:Transcriptional regulator with XRE-family HTH domain n=1 Tax=Azospirillum brasilense TaxID=192 RepID=A0A560BEQ6_AZOBR|nr:transcriptional regulator with XRE-family HTH domain [Azospirillum brasilense]